MGRASSLDDVDATEIVHTRLVMVPDPTMVAPHMISNKNPGATAAGKWQHMEVRLELPKRGAILAFHLQ